MYAMPLGTYEYLGGEKPVLESIMRFDAGVDSCNAIVTVSQEIEEG